MRARQTFWIIALTVGLSAPALAQTDTSARPAPRQFIGRLLGVFDAEGQPIEGVEVLDMLAKTSATTTVTGTIALTFVDTGGSMLRIRKLGYEAQLLTVSNRPVDPPITVVLARSGVVLPAVKSTASRRRTPADTVRKLDLTGFYDRRDNSGAAPMAFVMGERIQHMTTFDDFQSLTGRAICTGNLFIDGIRVKGTQFGAGLGATGRRMMPRNLKKNIADQFVDPSWVLAIENYRVGEVPVEYNQTKDAEANNNDCGATLIWTK